jgi:hypothetical protein
MLRRGPLAGSYAAAVALVICALVPFLALTAAVLPLSRLLSKSLGMSKLEFLPEFGAAVVTAALFGALFRTRPPCSPSAAWLCSPPRRRCSPAWPPAAGGWWRSARRSSASASAPRNEGELAWASPRLFARFREERPQPREARSAGRQTRDPAEGT